MSRTPSTTPTSSRATHSLPDLHRHRATRLWPGRFAVPSASAPGGSALGLVVKNPGAAVAAPGFNAQSQNAPSPPSGRRRRGGAQVALCAGNPRSPSVRRRTAPTTFRMRPATMIGACGPTPRLAATGCMKACRPRRWRFVACTSRRTVHRHAARPCNGASTPRLKQEAACYVRDAFTSSLGVVLARARAQAGEAVTREAESAMFLSERVGPRRPVCL